MKIRAPQLVGRDRELRFLDGAVEAVSAGRGASVFLTGEAGIGKSRLAAETTGRAFAAGMKVLRGRGSAIGPTIPFRPLTEALLSVIRGGDRPDYNELGPYRPVLGRLVPDWSSGDSAPDNGSLVLLGEAVLRLTAILGRDRGCLLVLEDLHEADAETLAVVDYLVDNVGGLPIMLLATIRDEPCAATVLADSAARRGSAGLLELRRLGRAQVCELAASCLEVEPADVPDHVAQRLWQDSGGNPFMVEELLAGIVDDGLLLAADDDRPELPELRADRPATTEHLTTRIDRLGPRGRQLLSVAAVLGHRFPLSIVQQVIGMDDHTLLRHLHAGVTAQLVAPDAPAPDWYTFHHPLTGEALLTALTPIARADLSRRAADAIEHQHPALPGEWCQLVASLRLYSGDPIGAARLFAEAGRRALADGAATSAISLLERAENLLSAQADAGMRAEVLESLLYALAEIGQSDRAFELVDRLNQGEGASLPSARRAALHVRLAYAAKITGRKADGLAQIAAARSLLGPEPADEDAAPLDAVAADLALDLPGPDRKREAEALARRAIAAAERVPLPAIACQAWVLSGTIARHRDLAESNDCFERSRLLAEKHRLPIWRVYSVYEQARNDWLSEGDTLGLDQVRTEALRVGAITQSHVVEMSLALHAVLCGEYPKAVEMIDACAVAANRLRLDYVTMYLHMTRAVLAGHRGRRQEMDQALAEFRASGGEHTPEQAMTLGMAGAFCALLEEDPARGRAAFAQLRRSEQEAPTIYSLAGRHGLQVLLDVLDSGIDAADFTRISGSVMSRMRWNRQFVLLAHAVLEARAGRTDNADRAVAESLAASAIYPMARHLGLRLIAEAAIADGWGDPETWLRGAEEYFHQTDVPAVASVCRTLLRQIGASVRQRRTGTEQVPAELRALGVTVREFEVFRLLVERVGNRPLAERLHISPRTVEKHIASLLIKTSQPNRDALHDYAAQTLRR